jgi:hypothetical protein
MKVKAWHIGCLVVLVLAALYFLVGVREGLDNPACWGNVVDASSGSFISQLGENSGMGAIVTGPKYKTLGDAQTACASDSTCTGVMKTKIPTGVGQQSEPGYIKYTGPPEIVARPGLMGIPAGEITFLPKIPCGSSSSSASSSPSATDDPKCPAGAPGISSVTLTGGQSVRLYTAGECSAMGGNFAANGAKNWGMANDSVGECLGTSNGINIGFCNQGAPPSAAAQAAVSPPPVMGSTAPMPPGPTGTAGGASMTPTVPSPAQTTPSYPAYSLTCMAAPVSGMKGSVGLPETPAAWNVSQPPSGWNSKNGYTTTGN